MGRRIFIDTRELHEVARNQRADAGELGEVALALTRGWAHTGGRPPQLALLRARSASVEAQIRRIAEHSAEDASRLDTYATALEMDEAVASIVGRIFGLGPWMLAILGVGWREFLRGGRSRRPLPWPFNRMPSNKPPAVPPVKPKRGNGRWPEFATPPKVTPPATAYAGDAVEQSRFDAWRPSYVKARPGSATGNDCVSWTWFRRQELGLPSPGKGNGAYLGKQPFQPAYLATGTIVSYGSGDGHAMVIEKVLSVDPPVFQVSEMNASGKGSGVQMTRIWSQGPNGLWTSKAPTRSAIALRFTP